MSCGGRWARTNDIKTTSLPLNRQPTQGDIDALLIAVALIKYPRYVNLFQGHGYINPSYLNGIELFRT